MLRMTDRRKLRETTYALRSWPISAPWGKGLGAGWGEELLLLQALSQDSRRSQVSALVLGEGCCHDLEGLDSNLDPAIFLLMILHVAFQPDALLSGK